MGEIRIVSPGKTHVHPYPVCIKPFSTYIIPPGDYHFLLTLSPLRLLTASKLVDFICSSTSFTNSARPPCIGFNSEYMFDKSETKQFHTKINQNVPSPLYFL